MSEEESVQDTQEQLLYPYKHGLLTPEFFKVKLQLPSDLSQEDSTIVPGGSKPQPYKLLPQASALEGDLDRAQPTTPKSVHTAVSEAGSLETDSQLSTQMGPLKGVSAGYGTGGNTGALDTKSDIGLVVPSYAHQMRGTVTVEMPLSSDKDDTIRSQGLWRGSDVEAMPVHDLLLLPGTQHHAYQQQQISERSQIPRRLDSPRKRSSHRGRLPLYDDPEQRFNPLKSTDDGDLEHLARMQPRLPSSAERNLWRETEVSLKVPERSVAHEQKQIVKALEGGILPRSSGPTMLGLGRHGDIVGRGVEEHDLRYGRLVQLPHPPSLTQLPNTSWIGVNPTSSAPLNNLDDSDEEEEGARGWEMPGQVTSEPTWLSPWKVPSYSAADIPQIVGSTGLIPPHRPAPMPVESSTHSPSFWPAQHARHKASSSSATPPELLEAAKLSSRPPMAPYQQAVPGTSTVCEPTQQSTARLMRLSSVANRVNNLDEVSDSEDEEEEEEVHHKVIGQPFAPKPRHRRSSSGTQSTCSHSPATTPGSRSPVPSPKSSRPTTPTLMEIPASPGVLPLIPNSDGVLCGTLSQTPPSTPSDAATAGSTPRQECLSRTPSPGPSRVSCEEGQPLAETRGWEEATWLAPEGRNQLDEEATLEAFGGNQTVCALDYEIARDLQHEFDEEIARRIQEEEEGGETGERRGDNRK